MKIQLVFQEMVGKEGVVAVWKVAGQMSVLQVYQIFWQEDESFGRRVQEGVVVLQRVVGRISVLLV